MPYAAMAASHPDGILPIKEIIRHVSELYVADQKSHVSELYVADQKSFDITEPASSKTSIQRVPEVQRRVGGPRDVTAPFDQLFAFSRVCLLLIYPIS